MTPFMQSTQAQGIIDSYLKGDYKAKPNVNSAGNFRNPFFDLRTEQENAGTLDPSALYPNPQIDFSAENETVDPCPEGFMLVDGVCQPIETFGQSMYDENRDDNNVEERPYMSIDDMTNASDYDLLKYLDDGWLKGDKFNTTIGGQFGIPPAFQFMFGGQNKMRRDFIIDELTRRGYATGVNDKNQNTFNLGNAFGIISNAEAANQGGNKLATNQLSIFTPDEINYQIDAKNKAQNIVNQGGNSYGQSFSGNAQQIENQVVQDAINSGGTVNPFEAQNINAGGNNNSTVSSPPTNVGNPFGYNNKPNKPPFLR